MAKNRNGSAHAAAMHRAISRAIGMRRHNVRTALSDAEFKGLETFRRSRGLSRAQAIRALIVLAYTFNATPKRSAPHTPTGAHQHQPTA